VAELYLDDAERRIKANMTALINAAKAIPEVETKTASKATTANKEPTKLEQALAADEIYQAQVAESAKVQTALKQATTDPLDIRSETTKLTPAQVAAQQALKEASEAATALGIQNVIAPTLSGVVGKISKAPTTPPREGYEWAYRSTAGGGIEWYERPISGYWLGRGGRGGNGGNGNNGNNTVVNGGQTTNIDVLKSLLRGMGFTTSLIDSSADFLNRLLKDGLDYDNAISIFLDSKEYTFKNGQKVISPFYTAYGYLNEGLTVPKSAADLFNAVEGYKEVIAKYNLNEKFISSDSLKKYIKNDIKVSDLDARANAARLKAINADPSYTSALMQLGYIKAPTDLTDFFLNPDIGKEALEQNRATAAFSAEAIRRAQQGITFDATRFKQISAGLIGKGLSEEQVSATAATGFEIIGEQLGTTQKLAGVYERMPASEVTDIQKELEAEQFLGTASQRRKRLSELETRGFQGAAGTTTSSLKRRSAGII
jgi:hypothetical protein